MADSLWAGVFGALAVVLFAAALRDRALARKLRRHGVHAPGRVVDRVSRTTRDSVISVPVMAFTDGDGRAVRFKPKLRGTGMDLPVGHEVQVVYVAGEPETARVFSRRHMGGPVVFLSFAGLVFLWVAITLVMRA